MANKSNTSSEGKTAKTGLAAAETNAAEKKAADKKLADKKPADKKPAAAEVVPESAEAPKAQPKKEAAPAVKKPAVKAPKAVKESLVPELFVQYDDDPAGAQEANVSEIVARVKAAYVAEGHRESSIKSLKVYMKPQEWKAYYVINNKIEGQINLF